MTNLYSINLDWLEQNKRSFIALASSRLCPQCQESLLASSQDPLTEDKLLETFQKCCSQREGFISASQPIMESLFRLFIATGNRPLTLEEINQELKYYRGERLPPLKTLQLLLEKDTFYGVHQLAETTPEQVTQNSTV